jgi:hypothetical protein
LERAALRVLDSARDERGRALTIPQAAKRLGDDGGIETLVVFVGNNNVLPAMTDLKLVWSDDGYDDLERKRRYTIWRPTHFRSEIRLLADHVAAIDARHVIWCTVPHVTILPVVRGVGGKLRARSRYFRYYTRLWIDAGSFDPQRHAHITGDEARIVDSTIDQYNDAIVEIVQEARAANRDWLLCDIAGMIDRFAWRRYGEDPAARPSWWRPLWLPQILRRLQPPLDSQFFASGPSGRSAGGFISLDGIHPTTTFYGLLAQYVAEIMRSAGVAFPRCDGKAHVQIDFARLLAHDSLLSNPPHTLQTEMGLLGWIEDKLGVLRHILHLA